jgi:hypothetical protein
MAGVGSTAQQTTGTSAHAAVCALTPGMSGYLGVMVSVVDVPAMGIVALTERVRLIGVVPRSDGEGEFGEGRREPMLWVEFHAEFVVAAADVLDECVSGADHAGRAEPFEATHRPESALEGAVALRESACSS